MRKSYCVDPGVGRDAGTSKCVDVLFSSYSSAHHKVLQKQNKIIHSRKNTVDQGPTNGSTHQRLHVWTSELSSLTREIRHGASRPDPHETSVSRVNRNVTGRVRLGQEMFEISRGGSGRVNKFSNLSGRVKRFSNSSGQVGSGQVKTSQNVRRAGRVS